MRQRISHGATIDAATPDEVARLIAAAFDTQRDYDYHREMGAINLDASGNGSASLYMTRQYAWLMDRVALTAGGPALIGFYNHQQQGSDLIEIVQLGSAGMYSDGFSRGAYLPAGNKLLIVCTGGAANGQMTYNLQIRLIKAVEE